MVLMATENDEDEIVDLLGGSQEHPTYSSIGGQNTHGSVSKMSIGANGSGIHH